MQPKDWTICLIEPNKFEAKIMIDILRNEGVDKFKVVADSTIALDVLEAMAANIIIAAVESTPVDGVTWTKGFRRNTKVVNRKAPIFLTSPAFSRALAEDCRHAGVNALIGKPISGKALIATINKVLGAPREFIDAPGYVGPCRRAGIVTAGPAQRRRQVDASKPEAVAEENTLVGAVGDLAKAIAAFASGTGSVDSAHVALKRVQAYAVNAGDGPLMRACAAFGLQLSQRGMKAELMRTTLEACMAGVAELAATSVEDAQRREAMAETVRAAVAKAATQRAA